MTGRKQRRSFYKAFARRLRETRIALGLTEEEAARSAGRSVATWRRYEETGEGYITGPILLFTRKHDINLDWLFAGDGPAPRLRPRLRLVNSSDAEVAS